MFHLFLQSSDPLEITVIFGFVSLAIVSYSDCEDSKVLYHQ